MKSLDEINCMIATTEAELAKLNAHRSELLSRAVELQREKAVLLQPLGAPDLYDKPIVTNQSSREEKIAIFRSLFRGREDIYPRRFESVKTGKKGYQPVCHNEWWMRGFASRCRVRQGQPKVRVFDGSVR